MEGGGGLWSRTRQNGVAIHSLATWAGRHDNRLAETIQSTIFNAFRPPSRLPVKGICPKGSASFPDRHLPAIASAQARRAGLPIRKNKLPLCVLCVSSEAPQGRDKRAVNTSLNFLTPICQVQRPQIARAPVHCGLSYWNYLYTRPL